MRELVSSTASSAESVLRRSSSLLDQILHTSVTLVTPVCSTQLDVKISGRNIDAAASQRYVAQ
jgi:hypothetical protein